MNLIKKKTQMFKKSLEFIKVHTCNEENVLNSSFTDFDLREFIKLLCILNDLLCYITLAFLF